MVRYLFPKMASNEIEGSATERHIPEETDYKLSFRCPSFHDKDIIEN